MPYSDWEVQNMAFRVTTSDNFGVCWSKGREPGAKGASQEPMYRHANVPALAPKALMRYSCREAQRMAFRFTTSDDIRICFSKGREPGAKGASQEPMHRHTNVPALAPKALMR